METRLLILILSSVMTLATTVQPYTDSIALEQTLQEVVALILNMERMDNYIPIHPDANQQCNMSNAYELLQSCFIAGVEVDMQTNTVEAMDAQSTFYINGQPCDARDLVVLRPRDIEKMEYYDISEGKYSNDRTAIHFIEVCGNEAASEDQFRFDIPFTRLRCQESDYKRNGEHEQLRQQYQGQHNYLTNRLMFVNTDQLYNRTAGTSAVTDFLLKLLSGLFTHSTFDYERYLKCEALPICMGLCITKNYEDRKSWNLIPCTFKNAEFALESYLIEQAKKRGLIND